MNISYVCRKCVYNDKNDIEFLSNVNEEKKIVNFSGVDDFSRFMSTTSEQNTIYLVYCSLFNF